MKKCKYCGKKIENFCDFCGNQCDNNYKEVTDKDICKIKYFIGGMIIGFLVIFCGILLSNNFMIGIGIMLMGIIVSTLPFTTPETITLFGYQKAKIIGRILGVLMIIVGIWVGIV